MTNHVSRLAPSPTGALHLGNARTFLVNWALARQAGWRLSMRLEDLDGPRIASGAEVGTLETLAWLGLDHDGEPLRQSDDLTPYREAMTRLADAGLVYPCRLTRKEIEQAARAPHANEHELRFPPELRATDAPFAFDVEDTNYRFRVPDASITVEDGFAGVSVQRPFDEVGDFVVWTKRGAPSYQLAVVVDDVRQQVTDVVRGDDLLSSAARQTMLYRALGSDPPRWWHLPLVLGPDGHRLAKRHGDTRVATYREAGVAPERVIGLIAGWCGLPDSRVDLDLADFLDRFDLARLSRHPVTFTEDDHRWLLRDA